MKNVGKYYEQGCGVLSMVRYWQFSDANLSAQVVFRE